jgi:Zn-dependent protease with chaperone function
MRFFPRFKISAVLFVTALLACIAASIVHFGPLSLLVGLSATFIGTLTGILAGSKRIPTAWTRITAVVFCLLTLLFVSYGPATWMFATFYTADSRPEVVASTHRKIYLPVSHCVLSSPRPIRDVMVSYLAWWMPCDVTFHDWGDGIGWSSQSKQLPGRVMTYTLLHY